MEEKENEKPLIATGKDERGVENLMAREYETGPEQQPFQPQRAKRWPASLGLPCARKVKHLCAAESKLKQQSASITRGP